MKKVYNKIKSIITKNKRKMKTGSRVRLVMNPVGKESSSNNHRKDGQVYIVTDNYGDKSWYVKNELTGMSSGWVYEWEMELITRSIVDISNEISKYQNKIDSLKTMVQWMEETGSTEFDEDEYRVWSAITAMENNKLSKMEKVKLISSLLKK